MSEFSSRSANELPHSIAETVDNHQGSTDGRLIDQLSALSIGAPILLGGFIAGTIDIGSACLINGAKPSVILQAIAGGLLGKSSFAGGPATVVLGLVLQWAMSIVIAAIFVVTSRWRPVLRRRWITAGLAYGVAVFIVMNYVKEVGQRLNGYRGTNARIGPCTPTRFS
jgi:hypothetical protein